MDSIKTELNAYNIRDLSPSIVLRSKHNNAFKPQICGYILLQCIKIVLYYY